MSENTAVTTPEDLRKNFERLQTDLALLHNELDQALSVWQNILQGEKQEITKKFDEREKTWVRDEAAWENDRQAYERKIQELESFFHAQLAQTEKQAVKALDDLDAAWQQERSRWQENLEKERTDARQTGDSQAASHQQLEQRLAQLVDANTQLQSALAESQVRQAETHTTYSGQEQQWQEYAASLETQLSHLQAEKTSWQQALSEQFQQHQDRNTHVQELEQQVLRLEAQLQEAGEQRASQEVRMETYVASLEKQISSLQDFIQQVIPSHPLRRKSDQTWGPAAAPPSNASSTRFPRVSR